MAPDPTPPGGVILAFAKNHLQFASPLTHCLFLGFGVLWLWRKPHSPWPRRYLGACFIAYFLLTTPIGAGLMVESVGHGFTRIQSRADANGADAVVVLSGGSATMRVADQVAGALGWGSLLRALEGARVFKIVNARLAIVSGGIVDKRQLRPESQMLREVMIGAGVPAGAIVEESLSRTTHEQAQLVGPILAEHGVSRFALVTSPTHMRRSLAVFRAAGLDPVPAVAPIRPDNLQRPFLLLPSSESVLLTDEALYDAAAWIYYWLNGWTNVAAPPAAQ